MELEEWIEHNGWRRSHMTCYNVDRNGVPTMLHGWMYPHEPFLRWLCTLQAGEYSVE